ncbi:MAG: murein biosynthesis integral membrane protein MurJ, partial [Noviherbaspirillum sp.]
PTAVGLVTLTEPLTSTLYHYGKFDTQAVTMTARALIAYGVGLIGLILVKILAPGFFAKQDMKTPVKIGIGVLIATQVMNLIFVPWIAHAGLALSVGLGACLNAGFLYWGLRRRGIYVAQPGWRIFLAKLTGALFLLAGVALWTAGQFNWVGMQSQPLHRVGALAVVMIACGVSYFGALLAMGFRFRDFKRVAH